MTGFGRASFELEGAHFDVEVRTLNHRYLDVGVRLPRFLAPYEAELRSRVQEHFARGKADVSVSMGAGNAPAPRLEIDLGAAAQYVAAADRLRERYGLPGAIDVASVLALPGVARITERELSDEPLRAALREAVELALRAADAMRAAEGEVLERELRTRLARILELTRALEERAGLVQAAVRERLRKRAEQLRQETGLQDEARLAQEVVIAADRLDVTEELVRLRSHVEQFERILAEGGASSPVGRRLDFLLQELGREANTVGSKGGDAPVAHLVVELKSELERVREQVQNVE
jgi:uncharacterized protein (TIGR00255 family)